MSESDQKRVEIRRLLRELYPYRRDLTFGIILLFIAVPATLFHPLIWKFVIDNVLGKGEVNWLVPALILMVVVHGFGLLLGAWRDRLFERAGQQFVRDLRNRVFRKLNRQSPGYLHQQRIGDLNSRVISDIQTIQSSIVSGLSTMLDELVSFAVVLGVIITINWMIGIFVIIPLTITFIIVSIFNQRVKRLYREASQLMGKVGARLQDSLSGHAIIHAFGRRQTEEDDFHRETDKHFKKTMEGVRLRTTIFPSVFFIGFTTNVIMLGLGAWLVLEGQLTLGGLVAIRIYWWQLNSPMRTLATVNDLMQRALASGHRVYEVLDAPEALSDPKNPKTLSNAKQPIRFEHVDFQYDQGKPVLRDLNFTIEPNTRVAMAGTSGGGKTTILNLLLRFYDPTRGQILCGDMSLDAVRREHWRSFVAPVFQETFLFHASIRDNLRYGKPDATDAELEAALEKANALHFVRETPDGLSTVVGERGVKLSGGQRQRIGIARAFLANPPILLLDEPTSSVEPESEQIIIQSVEDLMEGRTVILTSHRATLLNHADRVLFLREGRIEEDGPHAKLVANGGLYARIYSSWAEAEALETLCHDPVERAGINGRR